MVSNTTGVRGKTTSGSATDGTVVADAVGVWENKIIKGTGKSGAPKIDLQQLQETASLIEGSVRVRRQALGFDCGQGRESEGSSTKSEVKGDVKSEGKTDVASDKDTKSHKNGQESAKKQVKKDVTQEVEEMTDSTRYACAWVLMSARMTIC